MSPRLARFALALIGLIALATTKLRADTLAYGGRHEFVAISSHYEAVHVHNWDWRKSDELHARPDVLDAFFTDANNASSVVVRERATGKAIIDTPAPALTHLWISPDETLLVGLSNVKLRNPVQLAVWRLPSGQLLWREHIAPQQAELGAEAMADHLLAHPENTATLAAIIRKAGDRYFVDFLQSGMPGRLGESAWANLASHLAPHPYSTNFSDSVTNHVFWYREPNPGLRLDPGAEAGTTQLSLLDPRGIRFRIQLPAKETAIPQPSPAAPYPVQDIRLTDPRELRPDDFGRRRIEEKDVPPFILLHPDTIDVALTGQLQQTLRERLGITEPYALFSPEETELAAARIHTRYLYLVVPALRGKTPAHASGEMGQLLGVKIAGRRCVLVNMLPQVASRADTTFQLSQDGAPRIFQVLYDIEADSITHWHFNGGR